MNVPPWQFQRAYTPELIKRLLQLTCIVTLVSVALDPWLNLQPYLALTPWTYERLFVWQPITSIFLIPSAVFSFGFIIDFAFTMLILWLLGSLLLERIGKKQFLFVYLASGILGGLAALFAMHKLAIVGMLSTCQPAILAITTLWCMADPYQEILLFFVLPLKAKWVLVVALLGTIFASFIQQDLVSTASYSVAFLFSYLYGLAFLDLRSPFDWMQGLDRLLQKISRSFQALWQWRILGSFRKWRESKKAKDEAFVDKTLDKIAKSGTSSLNLYEKIRLKWISLKKRQSR